ncbi:hypothetical protein AAW12_04940 [Sphingobacterium sp. Ag1]|uniref:RagB/SusD family nutrient uptake outer membrane protein n=1 Tax=Sphingobacterium sp. Ag1 TaxID=1643451 RepID=UPI000627DF6F|nr:RagB/SusD family nutrient uptake outer membrane protein [Sphingobacterium sp. Ag1]KKO92451.1 hypothetical protein AAW12_04940 [Sphingobacterium sp. Ag1]
MKRIIVLLLVITLGGCTKDFLSVKSDKKLVIPSTLKDFRALMDRTETMNEALPHLAHLSADDHYLSKEVYDGLTSLIERNTYIWNKDIYEGSLDIVWSNSYQQIFYANNVLDGLEVLASKQNEAYYLKGTALFFRAFGYFNLSQIYCDTYTVGAENGGLGLPLRLKSDINEKVGRSTVGQTYAQIEKDLKDAIELLSTTVSVKTRPSKYAAQALLARLYLIMGRYEECLALCQSILPNFKLIDYTKVNTSVAYPMVQFNEEVIFHSIMSYASHKDSKALVDTNLMRAYADDDLRLKAFFAPRGENAAFIGNYSGSLSLFNGLAIDEVYLMAMECLTRTNKLDEAKSMYQTFMASRLRDHRIVVLKESITQAELLNIVLLERRKSLLYRGIRFSDIRRLNRNEKAEITMMRVLGDRKIEIKPNSPNYILPIPDNVIDLSGIEQNLRE